MLQYHYKPEVSLLINKEGHWNWEILLLSVNRVVVVCEYEHLHELIHGRILFFFPSLE